MAMTYIKRVKMTGFKSFGARTLSVKLGHGYTCIIGPNGNGKSNIIDALCFALGRMSKKTMRAKSLEDLIFAGTKRIKPANKAEVEIVFDNTNRVFPIDNDEFTISRFIKRGGSSGYGINGKRSTRGKVLNALATASVDPDGSNQFVLQGKIVELTHMSTNSRREFIETLIGLEHYDRSKEKVLKELERADRDLVQFEAIFKEVSTQLIKVEREKNDALKWVQLKNDIEKYNGQLLALKVQEQRSLEAELSELIEKLSDELTEAETLLEDTQGEEEQEEQTLQNLKESIALQEEMRQQREDTISETRAKLSAAIATIDGFKTNIKGLESRKEKLLEQQEKLGEGETYQDLVAKITQKVEEIEWKINEANNEIEAITKLQDDLQKEVQSLNQQNQGNLVKKSEKKQEISKNTAEINMGKKQITKNEKKLQKLQKQIAELKPEDQTVEEATDAAKKALTEVNELIEQLKEKKQLNNNEQETINQKIENAETTRDEINAKMLSQGSEATSLKTQIEMKTAQIDELKERKKELETEYERLQGGTSVEDQIKVLQKKESELKATLQDVKNNLKMLTLEHKNSNMEQENLGLKRRKQEGKLNKTENALSIVEHEVSALNKEMKGIQRDLQSLESTIKSKKVNNTDIEAKVKKQQEQLEAINKKIEHYENERKLIEKRVKAQEATRQDSQQAVESILSIISVMIESIDETINEIYGEMQVASEDALGESIESIRRFFIDMSEIIEGIEEMVIITEEQKSDLEQIKMTLETAKYMTEDADTTIDSVASEIRSANETVLATNQKQLSKLVGDFKQMFQETFTAIKALQMSSSTDDYQAISDIDLQIKKATAELNEHNSTLIKLESQLSQVVADIKATEDNISRQKKRLEEIESNLKTKNEEISTKKEEIKSFKEEIKVVDEKIKKIKNFSKEYWTKQKEMDQQVETTQTELEKAQSDLHALSEINRIIDDIKSAEKSIKKHESDIEITKKSIEQVNQHLNKIKASMSENNTLLDNFKAQIKKLREELLEIQKEIDDGTTKASGLKDQISALKNVLVLIQRVEVLQTESTDAEAQIKKNEENIAEIKVKIESIDVQIKRIEDGENELKSQIAALKTQEKVLRNMLDERKGEKVKAQKHLEEIERMIARETEINSIITEVEDLSKSIESGEQETKDFEAKIEQLNLERTKIIEKLEELNADRKESENNLSEFRQKIISYNSNISKISGKINEKDSKRNVCSDKIDELIEASEEFGGLGEITEEISEAVLKKSIATATDEQKQLEPVNLKAIQFYEEVKTRFDEINMRRMTLQRERKAILDAVERIELEKRKTFLKAFNAINKEFSQIFEELSPGGSAQMVLENLTDPFQGGIGIKARPRGKKISSLEILSGGEKTLVALSFIFAVQVFYPAPFYIMDEIDAALDGPNVDRVSQVIKRFASEAQFLIISHREENIINADTIYGITMQNGITHITAVDLQEEHERILAEEVDAESAEGEGESEPSESSETE